MNDIFDLLDLCLVILEGYLTHQECKDILYNSYYDINPSQWQEILVKDKLMLGSGGDLRRAFQHAGILSVEDMSTIVLQMFYLRHRS